MFRVAWSTKWYWTFIQLALPDGVPKIMTDDVSYVFSNVRIKGGFY